MNEMSKSCMDFVPFACADCPHSCNYYEPESVTCKKCNCDKERDCLNCLYSCGCTKTDLFIDESEV